jgi:hypothetical protein
MTDDDESVQARPNRKDRRKANALTKKTTPLLRPGVPIHTGTCARLFNTPDGPQKKYYWWTTENGNLSPEELAKTVELHGPFDTKAEADEAAQIAVVGPDCEVIKCGMWDPAWEKPQ